ncbi:MAG TPA: hypothetical protein VE866_16725, partial [Candidatus Binatia bacterium]|nr:hypothetical protein [Candidatus Binatia bacterium]
DRHTGPQIVPSTPVMYAGWPNGEVWRHRPSTDPVEGVQIVVKPAKHFIRERHIAFAILKDFLGNEYRARRLSPGFGMLVVRDLPEKRWLLTEVDIQNGIRAVEAQCSLCWLEEGECYAGDCKTEKLDPAEQRKRADWAGKHLNRAEQSDSALVAAQT